jgi:hypothetical protein
MDKMKATATEKNKYDNNDCWIRSLPNGNIEYFSKIYYTKNFERRDGKIIKQIEDLLNDNKEEILKTEIEKLLE